MSYSEGQKELKTENFNHQVIRAAKWSGVTEIIAKIVTPVSSIVLARLLTPDAFGVVATIVMVISFAELFTDAGFQKYLIQHEFKNLEDFGQSVNVAFWSNLIFSFILWGAISFFADSLATLVGSPGCGLVLIVACVSIPLEAFSSIQIALHRRNLDFKTLFKVRIVSLLVPLFFTIPVAFFLRSYWALIWGMIIQNLFNALLLTCYSNWKPALFYSYEKLKEMLSFTIWSLVESVSIWLTGYVDVFIVGTLLNQYYLGLYKTSMALVGQITSLVTMATAPVLFSSLSRLQNDEKEFKRVFLLFQKLISVLVIPMGGLIFCFSDTITLLALGRKWIEAAHFIGLWGLTSSFMIVFSNYVCEIYRAKGLPKLSVLSQWLHLIVMCPVVLISVKYGFETLCTARSLIRFQGLFVDLVLLYFLIRISPWQMLKNVMPSLVSSVVIVLFAYGMRAYIHTTVMNLILMSFCAVLYTMLIWLFPYERKMIKSYLVKLPHNHAFS